MQKKHFETKHDLSLDKIAATFKINYQCADNKNDAIECLNNILKSDKIQILEFFTGNSNNEGVLNDYFSTINNN
jgi:2-succinyl-5-enolpyruvyl-6-hydroxy-3-cyclohexene-1-carboxylate synthase